MDKNGITYILLKLKHSQKIEELSLALKDFTVIEEFDIVTGPYDVIVKTTYEGCKQLISQLRSPEYLVDMDEIEICYTKGENGTN